MKKSTQILILALIAVLAASCATQQKLKTIREGQVQNVQLTLADDVSYLPEMKVENLQRDTLTIKDDDGTEILIMKAIKDEESGEMSCTVSLDEDEMLGFMLGRVNACPYYRQYDEYKSVQKQN